MKRFLSLVLTLVMVMSLVTVSAGAKDFTDADTITYGEAIDVISTIGVVDGDTNGSFRPTDILTRQAAAKIICNLILGPTTAAELHADTAPYRDVPTTSQFAGYIAYCAKEGIISGYGNGTFRPTAPLTGYAFMKMLLGALGYNATNEGYVGANWSINVAKQAIGIGLNASLQEEFNGLKSVNREEACLYAFNTLRATTVGYGQKITTTVNGVDVTLSTGGAQVVTWTEGTVRNNHIKNDNLVQFAEEHFPKLYLEESVTVFGQPDREWEFDGRDIGTYVNYDLLREEYTKKVTGKDLSDLLGRSLIENDNYRLLVTIDGETDGALEGLDADGTIFNKSHMVRANDKKVGETGKGVLTQVFVNPDRESYGGQEIFVAIINTYLAKAVEDYNEKDENVDFEVWNIDDKGTTRTARYVKDDDETEIMTIEAEDFEMVKDVSKDDIYLVRVADGEVQEILEPEILSESSITSFKKTDWVISEGSTYDYADTAKYDPEVLDEYDQTNMKDVTYNIILDPYGYLIGLELNEDPDQYVFLTGVETGLSNLSTKTVDANVIHMDGTMETVKVDMSKSKGGYKNAAGDWVSLATALARRNLSQANTWCKYSIGSNGVYTLKEVPVSDTTTAIGIDSKVKVAQYAQNLTGVESVATDRNSVKKALDTKHVSLLSYYDTASNYFGYVYANDETTIINVDLKAINVDDTAGGRSRWIIDDVESVTLGVKNVELEMVNAGPKYAAKNPTGYIAPEHEIYTLYNNKGAVIGVVTIGEDNGSTAKYVYVTSDGPVREDLGNTSNTEKSRDNDHDGTWTWYLDVIIDGKKGQIVEVGDTLDVFANMNKGQWYEIKTKADGSIRKATALTPVADGKMYEKTNFVYLPNMVQDALEDHNTVVFHQTTDVNKLNFDRGQSTLWTDANALYRGFSVSPDVKVVLMTAKDGNLTDDFRGAKRLKNMADEIEDKYTGYTGVEQAIRDMYAWHTQYTVLSGHVEVSAIIVNGAADVIVINDLTPAMRRTNKPDEKPIDTSILGTNFNADTGMVTTGAVIDGTELNVVRNNIVDRLTSEGYTGINLGTSANAGGHITFSSISAVKDGLTRYLSADGTLYYKVTLNKSSTPAGYIKAEDGKLVSDVKISNSKTYVEYDGTGYYTTAGAQALLDGLKSGGGNKNINVDTGFYYVGYTNIAASGSDTNQAYFTTNGTWTADFDNAANYYTTANSMTLKVDLADSYTFSNALSVAVKATGTNETVTKTVAKDEAVSSLSFDFDIDKDITGFVVTVKTLPNDVTVDATKYYLGATSSAPQSDASASYYGLTVSGANFAGSVTPGGMVETTLTFSGSTADGAVKITLDCITSADASFTILGGNNDTIKTDSSAGTIEIAQGVLASDLSITVRMIVAAGASDPVQPTLLMEMA